jgi:hypothetical protein
MNPAMAADAMVALAVLGALLCLFYGPWQSACTDLGRQFIFERRDKLFDMALAGRISFDSEAYQSARQTLNGFLRFAHELTWPEILVGTYFIHKRRPHVRRWQDTLTSLPPDVRREIEDLVRECTVSLIAMMALKSIFIAPLVAPACVVFACTSGLNVLTRKFAANKELEPLFQTIQTTSEEYAESETVVATAS